METSADECYRQGAQGILDGASKAMLENEFGTAKEEDVVAQILEKGEIQEGQVCTLLLPFKTEKDRER